MPLSDDQVRALLLACRETHADEIDCEQFLTFAAEYAEARAEGRVLPRALAKVEEHERLCPNCREECGALAELIRSGHDTR
jgi:predicted anti-sigma-YlaC factor YlaD